MPPSAVSIQEQIVQAALAALNGAGRPADVPVYVRTRVETPQPEQLPVNTLYWKRDLREPEPPRLGSPIAKRSFLLVTETLTKRTATEVEDQAADPSTCWAVRKVMGSGRFGGLSGDIENLGPDAEYAQTDVAVCRVTTLFRVWFINRLDDLTLKA